MKAAHQTRPYEILPFAVVSVGEGHMLCVGRCAMGPYQNLDVKVRFGRSGVTE